MECTVCHSTRLEENDLGFYTCADCGTQSRAFHEEQNEYGEELMAGGGARSLSRIYRTQQLNEIDIAQDVIIDSHLLLSAFQHLLRAQCLTLISTYHVHVHVFDVVGRLWSSVMEWWIHEGWDGRMIRARPAAGMSIDFMRAILRQQQRQQIRDMKHEQQQQQQQQHDKRGKKRKRRNKKQDEKEEEHHVTLRHDDEKHDITSESESDMEMEMEMKRTSSTLHEDMTLPIRQDEQEEKTEETTGNDMPSPPPRTKVSKDDRSYRIAEISLPLSLALVTIACHVTHENITLDDLITAAERGVLPYLHFLTSDLTHSHLTPTTHSSFTQRRRLRTFFTPHDVCTPSHVIRICYQLMNVTSIGVAYPHLKHHWQPNAKVDRRNVQKGGELTIPFLLITRYITELALPPIFITYTHNLISYLISHLTTCDPVDIMSCILIVCKMIWKLDDNTTASPSPSPRQPTTDTTTGTTTTTTKTRKIYKSRDPLRIEQYNNIQALMTQIITSTTTELSEIPSFSAWHHTYQQQPHHVMDSFPHSQQHVMFLPPHVQSSYVEWMEKRLEQWAVSSDLQPYVERIREIRDNVAVADDVPTTTTQHDDIKTETDIQPSQDDVKSTEEPQATSTSSLPSSQFILYQQSHTPTFHTAYSHLLHIMSSHIGITAHLLHNTMQTHVNHMLSVSYDRIISYIYGMDIPRMRKRQETPSPITSTSREPRSRGRPRKERGMRQTDDDAKYAYNPVTMEVHKRYEMTHVQVQAHTHAQAAQEAQAQAQATILPPFHPPPPAAPAAPPLSHSPVLPVVSSLPSILSSPRSTAPR